MARKDKAMKSVWFVEVVDYEEYVVDDDGSVYGIWTKKFHTKAKAVAYAKFARDDGMGATVYEAKEVAI